MYRYLAVPTSSKTPQVYTGGGDTEYQYGAGWGGGGRRGGRKKGDRDAGRGRPTYVWDSKRVLYGRQNPIPGSGERRTNWVEIGE